MSPTKFVAEIHGVLFISVALLERPVVISGKRERKKVERIDVSSGATPKEKKLEVPEGRGTTLGEIPNSTLPLCKHPREFTAIMGSG